MYRVHELLAINGYYIHILRLITSYFINKNKEKTTLISVAKRPKQVCIMIYFEFIV